MFRPIDIVQCFHNAFRRDIFEIDERVLKKANSVGDIGSVFDRLHILGEILNYHAKGEEAAVFSAVDKLRPSVSPGYLFDHHELDKMVEALEEIRKTPEVLTTARATAVLHSHLRIHLDKEDLYLYPILREQTTDEEQVAVGKIMSSKIPPERFPDFAQWLFNLLSLNDQIMVIKGWMTMMPPSVFSNAKVLIRKNVGDNWVKIVKLIPQLSE